MAMTQINVAEATQLQLNWLVAKCEGHKPVFTRHWVTPSHPEDQRRVCIPAPSWVQPFEPSTNWAQGGPIIEREKIDVEYAACIQDWRAVHPHHHLDIKRPASAHGDTALVAAMRAYVIAKLGPIVEVPEELP